MIVFENEGLLELDAITTMGISVKENDNAIGFFGTGLKYAIAILLRAKHTVHFFIDKQHYHFTTRTKEIRGKEFEFVMMNDQQLGYTTDYGKNWEVWMAFRELACNTTDEFGSYFQCSEDDNWLDQSLGKTIIVVEGSEIDEAYSIKNEIFFDDVNAHKTEKLECVDQPSSYIYYRGVRILQEKTKFTYNILEEITLTEDRTAANYRQLTRCISEYMVEDAPIELVSRALIAETQSFERRNIDYQTSFTKPSEQFLEAVGKLYKSKASFASSAKTRFMKAMDLEEENPPMNMSPVQEKQLQRAIEFLKKFEDDIEKYEIVCCENLGHDILGRADIKKATVYLSKIVFDQGTKQVATTLLEEFYHLQTGHTDCNYAFQTFLFDKILSMAENAQGEPI